MNLHVAQKYGQLDCDTLMFLRHFNEPSPCDVLEVGAYEEDSAYILSDNGYNVTGYDLRERSSEPLRYWHIQGDFVAKVESRPNWSDSFDCAFSTSAIEHFGLRVYDAPVVAHDYDARAMKAIYRVLKPGGHCYVTVPFGALHSVEADWRVYDLHTLNARVVGRFEELYRVYFQSGDCPGVPYTLNADGVPLVSEKNAVKFHRPTHPHLTVLLKLRKPCKASV